jgi:hypothetical protein
MWDKAITYGPLGVIFLLIVAALIWYGPRFAEAHIALIKALTAKAEQDCDREERQTKALEVQAESNRLQGSTLAGIQTEIKQQSEILRTQLPFKCKHPGQGQ